MMRLLDQLFKVYGGVEVCDIKTAVFLFESKNTADILKLPFFEYGGIKCLKALGGIAMFVFCQPFITQKDIVAGMPD